ncbi:MAG: type IIL restriction-modification enzyme MmeI [Polyangiales bacterium]
MLVDTFVSKWAASGAAERANKDSFLNDLCDVRAVNRAGVTTGDPARDTYVFEKDAVLVHEGGKRTVGRIDLFKEGCFILGAKQGADADSKKTGTAKRNTPGWNVAMFDAYGWPTTLTDEEILERVVKLNAERAAEERDGHVRWLRPEFQNPKGGAAATQTALAEESPESAGDDASARAELPSWLKKSGERFAAVRAALLSSPEGWTAERVARRFKGAKREQVVDALEGLASLGLAVEWSAAEVTCWQAVQKSAG